MSIDPTGLPIPRTGAIRGRASAPVATDAPEGAADVTLKAESILLEEFESAGVAAYQAKENMAGLLNLYMVAAAALATGAGVVANAYTATDKVTVTLALVLLLGVGTLLSGAFFARLLDLSRDYRDSLIAMNLIKEFYIQRLRSQLPELATAFHRRLADVPRGRVAGRGIYAIGASITALGSIAAAATVGEARQVAAVATGASAPYLPEVNLLGLGVPYAWELLAALMALLVHYVYYRVQLRARNEATNETAR